MHDPIQPESVPDHELVECVFDVVDDIRDSVVEKHGQAMTSLRLLRDRANGSHRPGGDRDVESAGFEHGCPGCDAGARSVARAFQRGEPCPICGMAPDVAARVGDARNRTVGSGGRDSLARRYPLVAFLVARSVEADDRDDPAGRALARMIDRVLGWPRRGDGRMWQRDEDLLRIAAAAYDAHPDYDPRWAVR